MKKCHDCKSTNVAKILYGYPADMDKWKKDMDSGKFVAGGCVIRDDDPHNLYIPILDRHL